MTEGRSKLLLAVEATLFLWPLTMLTASYSALLLALYWKGFGSEPLEAHVAPIFTLLGLLIQFCGWWGILRFLYFGRSGLARLNKFCVGAMYLGAALAAVGGLAMVLMTVIEGTTLLGLLSVNTFGLPALVPFIHLEIERRRAVSSLRAASDLVAGN